MRRLRTVVGAAALLEIALMTPRVMAINSAASGYWTNAITWGGSIPGTGEDVVIAGGHTVTANVSTAALNSLTNNGTLECQGWGTLVLGWLIPRGTIITVR